MPNEQTTTNIEAETKVENTETNVDTKVDEKTETKVDTPDTTRTTEEGATTDVEIDIDSPYLTEDDINYIDRNYGDYGGESFDEPDSNEGRYVTEIKSEIDELKKLLKNRTDDTGYEPDEETDPKYAKLAEQLENLTKELSNKKKQDEDQQRQAAQQKVEQQNIYVIKQFLSKKIEPTLKLIGADKNDAQGHYVREGIKNEILTAIQDVEVNQLRGAQATPKIVAQICDHYYKHYVKKLNLGGGKANAGVPTGADKKSGAHPESKTIRVNELNTQKQKIAADIDKILALPRHEQISKGSEVVALQRELRKIIEAERALQ